MKILFGIIAPIVGAAAFIPYLRDTAALKTKPHPFSWLIWTITQGTAAYAVWIGGGGWGTLSPAGGALLMFGVFLFSLKYERAHINTGDVFIFFSALLAIVVWWQLDMPLLAVVMVSAIDVLGYIPSLWKVYRDPRSETLISWTLFAVSNACALLALHEYNLLTVTYLVALSIANTVLALVCLIRRSALQKLQA